jgi:hypothetical protein
MNALAREGVDVKTVNDVDLALKGFQGGEGLREFHIGALALGAPMILVDPGAQEDNAKTLGES